MSDSSPLSAFAFLPISSFPLRLFNYRLIAVLNHFHDCIIGYLTGQEHRIIIGLLHPPEDNNVPSYNCHKSRLPSGQSLMSRKPVLSAEKTEQKIRPSTFIMVVSGLKGRSAQSHPGSISTRSVPLQRSPLTDEKNLEKISLLQYLESTQAKQKAPMISLVLFWLLKLDSNQRPCG